MAAARTYTDPAQQSGTFHTLSRITWRTRCLLDEERDYFVRCLRAWEAFCQVRVLTFCVMQNHFHILVQVPERPDDFDPDVDAVLALWEAAVGPEAREQMAHMFKVFRSNGSEHAIEAWRKRMVARMFSLPEFMKALKQQFSQWFNKKTGRTGTLWEGPYTCVIVEDDERALRTMATYIDLNPVRAGIVQNPADYRWSGYGEAMAGKRQAREGLERVVWLGGRRDEIYAERRVRRVAGDAGKGRELGVEVNGAGVNGAGVNGAGVNGAGVNGGSGRRDGGAPGRRQLVEALVIYRSFMGLLGRELQFPDGTRKRRGLPEALAERFRKAGAGAVRTETLLRRVRHLTQGVIFGSRKFVDEWFTSNRARVCRGSSAEKRVRGSRPAGRALLPGMHTLRSLRE